jgi:midasin
LRRTQPNKRNYQVLLALDDSQSVALGKASPLMRESVATICIALQRLQVGQLSLVKFGDTVQLLHPFSQPFTDDAASLVMPQLTFDQKKTNMEELMRTSIQMLELSRIEAQGAGDTMQLMFVIGDGRFGDKRHKLREWLIRAAAKNIFVVFLVIDGLDKESILDIQSISYPGGKLTMKPYIDDFPFAYYVILKRIESLPNILADSLRQWFEMIAR